VEEDNKKPEGISWYHPASLIATWFCIGKIPFAPGTWGSLFTLPLFAAMHYLMAFTDNASQFVNLFMLCTLVLFIIGNWATNIYMRKTGKHDPKEVVIDEVVGQLLVFFSAFVTIAPTLGLYNEFYGTYASNGFDFNLATSVFLNTKPWVRYIIVSIPIYLICFGLFRLFDIWKPWPISYCDKNIKGGFGVMFDDIFAALYATIALYAITLLFR